MEKRLSAIATMSYQRVEDFYLVEGPVNGEMYGEFVSNSLLMVSKPFKGNKQNSIVVMDNTAIYRMNDICKFIRIQELSCGSYCHITKF